MPSENYQVNSRLSLNDWESFAGRMGDNEHAMVSTSAGRKTIYSRQTQHNNDDSNALSSRRKEFTGLKKELFSSVVDHLHHEGKMRLSDAVEIAENIMSTQLTGEKSLCKGRVFGCFGPKIRGSRALSNNDITNVIRMARQRVAPQGPGRQQEGHVDGLNRAGQAGAAPGAANPAPEGIQKNLFSQISKLENHLHTELPLNCRQHGLHWVVVARKALNQGYPHVAQQAVMRGYEASQSVQHSISFLHSSFFRQDEQLKNIPADLHGPVGELNARGKQYLQEGRLADAQQCLQQSLSLELELSCQYQALAQTSTFLATHYRNFKIPMNQRQEGIEILKEARAQLAKGKDVTALLNQAKEACIRRVAQLQTPGNPAALNAAAPGTPVGVHAINNPTNGQIQHHSFVYRREEPNQVQQRPRFDSGASDDIYKDHSNEEEDAPVEPRETPRYEDLMAHYKRMDAQQLNQDDNHVGVPGQVDANENEANSVSNAQLDRV